MIDHGKLRSIYAREHQTPRGTLTIESNFKHLLTEFPDVVASSVDYLFWSLDVSQQVLAGINFLTNTHE